MGKRGPAPQPTTLKVLRGNPGQRKLPENEPKPEPLDLKSAPIPPGLGAHGRRFWRDVVEVLVRLGIAGETDYHALHQAAMAYARWRKALTKWNKVGAFTTNRHGETVRSQEDRVLTECDRDLSRHLQQFGMTPSSRVGLAGLGKEAADNVDDFLKSRGKAKAG